MERADGSKVIASIGIIVKDDACMSNYLDELSVVEELEALKNGLAAWQVEEQRLAGVEFEIITEQWNELYEAYDFADSKENWMTYIESDIEYVEIVLEDRYEMVDFVSSFFQN